MSRMRWFRILAATGAFVLGAGAAGYAKPLLQEDFSSPPAGNKGGEVVKTGKKGFAWRAPGGDLPLKGGKYQGVVTFALPGGINGAEGTIEFDLTRAEVDEEENLVWLYDAEGNRLFGLYIQWKGQERGKGPLLTTWLKDESQMFYTKAKDDFNIPIQKGGTALALGKGQTAHIALTWGPGGARIYKNGARLPAFDASPGFFARIADQVAEVVVGGQVFKNKTWGSSRSLIANLQIHDVALFGNKLGQPIEKAREIAAVTHDAFRAAGFSGKLAAGNVLPVTVTGTPGVKAASFDIVHYPDVSGKIALDWRGWGVYLEEKTFFEPGEVRLRDVKGYRVFASQKRFDPAAPGMEPAATLKVGEQSWTLEYLEADKPYYVAVVADMADGGTRTVIAPLAALPLAETAPGSYTGAYTVTWNDRYARAAVVGRLGGGEKAATLVGTAPFAIDPSVTIAVAASPNELKADEKSTAQITVTATDVNGNPVAGHKIKFLLATTSQYTGVVGGGAFTEQVGGGIKEDYWGETDLFGKVTATYVAGFAAKTAVIVARDMRSNDTGAGWIKTYIQASAQLELEPVQAPLAAADGYEISVTSSDEWLTADGKSQARITAKVTRFGKPVEGHTVSFDVASGTGSIRVVKDVTGRDGEARAVYTAGKKIGMVLITATDRTVDISGSVQIELRSDAPAKIRIQIKPEKLPADGRSTAELLVLVTDVNDNPNDNTEVEYAVTEGSGRMRDEKTVTDRNGETTNEFVAGRTAGRVTIGLTVRSTVPSEEELLKARGLALAVTDFDFF